MITLVVYLLLLSTLCSLSISSSSSSSSVSPAIERMMLYNSIYRFSTVPRSTGTSAQYAIWWTPDAIVEGSDVIGSARNVLSVAAMSILKGYIGFAINNIPYPEMQGMGVVGVPEEGVSFYYLVPGFISKMSQQLNYSTVDTLDGFTTMQFVWDLNIGNSVFNFSVDTPELTVLYAASTTTDTTTQHTWAYYINPFDFKNGSNAMPLNNSQICDCSIKQIPNSANLTHCPCSCPGSAIGPTCLNNTLPYAITLMDDVVPLSTVRWRVKANTTYFDVQSESHATWFAIGFASSPEGNMKGSQAVIFTGLSLITKNIVSASSSGLLSSGALNISDVQMWSLQNGYPGFAFSVPYSELGGNPTVELVGVSSPNDAFGNDPHKYQTNGAYTINLLTGGVSAPTFIWSIKATHGILMYLAWVIFFPFGFLWARYAKGLPHAMWFEGHRLVMTLGFVIALSGACIAFGMVNTHFSTAWHSQVGMTALVLCLFQVCSGILRPHLDVNKLKSFQRTSYEILHHLFGRLAILLSWAAIYEGLVILPHVPGVFVYLHIVICVIWLLAHLILAFRAYFESCRPKYDPLNTNTKPKSYGTKN